MSISDVIDYIEYEADEYDLYLISTYVHNSHLTQLARIYQYQGTEAFIDAFKHCVKTNTDFPIV